MAAKEAAARIKSNKLLEAAGWRFFPARSAAANIRLEPSVTIQTVLARVWGEDGEGAQQA
jgi:type I restriction enzyme, R subunit